VFQGRPAFMPGGFCAFVGVRLAGDSDLKNAIAGKPGSYRAQAVMWF